MLTPASPASSVTYLAHCDKQAVDEYFNSLAARTARGAVLALVAEGNHSVIPLLQASAKRYGQQLLGVVSPGLITDNGFSDCGLHLIVLPSRTPYALLPLPANATEHSLAAGISTLIDRVQLEQSQSDDTLYLFFDGLVPYIASFIDALYLRLADRIHYVGTNVGSGSFKPMTCLFDQDQLIEHGVLAFIRRNQAPVALAHGYCMPPETHYATATNGNKIQHIDWRPALDVYCELVSQRYGITITRKNFYQHAVHMPFGIVRLEGEPIVRIPVAIDEDGAIYCVGEVPENTMLTLLDAPSPGSSATIDELVSKLKCDVFTTLLVMYCAGRRMHLGNESDHELASLQEKLPTSSTFGLISLGEVGETSKHSYPALHNGAIVCCPWDHDE